MQLEGLRTARRSAHAAAMASKVYAIGSFIPQHPGGLLIRRAIGEDATELLGAVVVAGRLVCGGHAGWSLAAVWLRQKMQSVDVCCAAFVHGAVTIIGFVGVGPKNALVRRILATQRQNIAAHALQPSALFVGIVAVAV
eukprot:Skav234513  [mRNA]  locus=scaffold2162:138958:139704:- [translate_table: standard]